MKKLGCLRRLFQFFSALVLVVVLLAWGLLLYPFWGIPFNSERQGNPPLTPAWALECWVWEDDTNTEESTLEMVNGHLKHDFPVQTVLIDSPWSTRYNDFIVDEARFPNAEDFFRSLDERDIRVVLWMTSLVNETNKDTAIEDSSDWFQAAAAQGFLINEGHSEKWWKGKGGFIDYTNPDAMTWWRDLQQNVFDWGIDGWKLDGTGTLAFTMKGKMPWFYVDTLAGRRSTREYMDHYYRDEYAHGLTQNPEFVTLSRSLDSVMPWGHPEGVSPIDASPVNWLGDNKHTWTEEERGLERAVRLTLESSAMGYNVVGSDIAGYHGDNPIDAELYIRWTQFSTFCGLFLNGGHGERRMWMRSPEELAVIRKFSWLHHELVPYMYQSVISAHEGGPRLMRAAHDGAYHYFFGDDLLVAPIVTPGNRQTVTLPEGTWRYWFQDKDLIEGPLSFTRDFPLDEYPVYVREGAILPMNISRDYTGIGDRASESFLTLNIYPGPERSYQYTDVNDGRLATIESHGGEEVTVRISGALGPYLLRVLLAAPPQQVLFNGTALEAALWAYDEGARRVIIRNPSAVTGTYLIH